MRSYAYYEHLSLKTRALNQVRRLFQGPPLERALRRFTQGAQPLSLRARFIPPEYLYRTGSWRDARIDGLLCRLDLSDTVCHSAYFGLADDGADRFLKSVGPDSVVVDIGANIGLRAIAFARAARHGRVIAFEPHPVSFERLKAHAEANALAHLTPVRLGIGNARQVVRLFEVVGTNPGMNRIIADPEAGDRFASREIEIDTLEHALGALGVAGVTHIKIDVEGYEMEVLRGSEAVLLRDRPALFIELDDDNLRDQGSSAADLVGWLEARGYKVGAADSRAALGTGLQGCHLDIIAEHEARAGATA